MKKVIIALAMLLTACNLYGRPPTDARGSQKKAPHEAALHSRLLVDIYAVHTLPVGPGERDAVYSEWLEAQKKGDTTVNPSAYPKLFHREVILKGSQELKEQFQDALKRPAVIDASLTPLPNGWVHIEFSRLGVLEPGEAAAGKADHQPVTTSLTIGAEQPRVLRLPPLAWDRSYVEEIVVVLRLEQLSATHQDKSSYEY